MKRLSVAIALIFGLSAGMAQTVSQALPTCLPPPVDNCGKGPVHGTVEKVEYMAWWVPLNFEWALQHWYRLPGFSVHAPSPGASSVKDYAIYLWPHNVEADRSFVTPHPAAGPACNAMYAAARLTRPPEIWYDVMAATAADGKRPGYKLVNGALVLDGTRHLAGAWCECWRAAVKPGTTQYCKVTKTESYAACRRTQ